MIRVSSGRTFARLYGRIWRLEKTLKRASKVMTDWKNQKAGMEAIIGIRSVFGVLMYDRLEEPKDWHGGDHNSVG